MIRAAPLCLRPNLNQKDPWGFFDDLMGLSVLQHQRILWWQFKIRVFPFVSLQLGKNWLDILNLFHGKWDMNSTTNSPWWSTLGRAVVKLLDLIRSCFILYLVLHGLRRADEIINSDTFLWKLKMLLPLTFETSRNQRLFQNGKCTFPFQMGEVWPNQTHSPVLI